jgi:hypothetical protein
MKGRLCIHRMYTQSAPKELQRIKSLHLKRKNLKTIKV